MYRLLYSAFVPVLALLLVPVARAGGISSSGGELVTVEHNPWFVGAAPVAYCIEVGPDFSATPAQAEAAVSFALADWLETMKKAAVAPEPPGTVHSPTNWTMELSLAFTQVGCHEPHELTFALGAATPAVELALAHHARFTVALALQEGFDPATGRARGAVIWLAPDRGEKAYKGPHVPDFWSASDKAALRAVLLHEIGHMFGIGHETGTEGGVMTAGFPARAVTYPGLVQARSSHYAEDNWWITYEPRCGEAFVDGTFAALLGLPAGSKPRACLQHVLEHYSQVSVEVTTADGAAYKALFKVTPYSPGCQGGGVPCDGGPWTTRFGSVRGYYPNPAGGPDREYRFIRLVDYLNLQGTLVLDGGREVAASLEQQRNGRLKITYVSPEADARGHWFHALRVMPAWVQRPSSNLE